MAQLSISAAARAVGKDRSTLNRYIKSGRLSISRDANGATVIETGELLRVFGALRGDGARCAASHPEEPVAQADARYSMHHAFEATLELLKQQLKASQEREAKLLDILEQEQHSRREMERRLLPPGTSEEVLRSSADDEKQRPLSASERPTSHSAKDNITSKGLLAIIFGK